MGHMKEKMTVGRFFVYLFAILFAFVCLYPFLMVIGGSLMTNSEVVNDGFKVFPKEVTFASYKLLLGNGNLILNGYKITLFCNSCWNILLDYRKWNDGLCSF